MPFGIGERMIEKAYGPQDFSYIYKSINNIQRIADAQNKAQKQAQQKEFYTSLGALNKNLSTIRSKDSQAVMSSYNKYKNTEKLLMSQPNLIERNPEQYGKLKAESDAAYNSAIQLTSASKQKKEYLQKLTNSVMTNPSKFKEGALTHISQLDDLPTSKIDESQLDNLDNLVYSGPDFNKVNKELVEIDKTKKELAKVNTYTDSRFGATVYSMYEIPDVVGLQNKIETFIGTKSKQDVDAIYDRFQPQYEDVKNAYNGLDDSYFEKFKTADNQDKFPLHTSPSGVQTRKPDINFDAPTSHERLNSFLLAKNIIGISNPSIVKGQESKTEFTKGDIGKKEMANALAFNLQSKLETIRQSNRKAMQTGYYDYRRQLGQVDKETELQFRILSGLVGTEAKIDLQYGDPLTDEAINNIISKLSLITGKLKPKKEAPVTAKEGTPKQAKKKLY